MPLTLLHTADLHLGKSFQGLPPERAEQRRADQLATLIRLCRKAHELQVDFLCIAGDLFDHRHPSAALLANVRAALADAGVSVLLLPGNHDALEAASPFVSTAWPSNVVCANQPGWQQLTLAGCEVLAFGYVRGEAHRNPWQAFPGCGSDAVLALHAACMSPGLAAASSYYPFTVTEIPPCSYLALGHHHRACQVNTRPLAWYAGTPEPLEAEATPSAALLVTMHGGEASVEPLDVATRHHRLVTIDVTGYHAEDIWDRARAVSEIDHLLTLRLTGMLDTDEPLDLAALRTELSAHCFAIDLVTDELYLPLERTHRDGVIGVLHTLAQEKLAVLPADAPERITVERALRYAVLALEGKL